MKKAIKISVMCCGMLMLASCGSSPKALYTWGDYDSATYSYIKDPSAKNEAELMANYERMMDNQAGVRKVVPPGMCAELGYMYFKKGDKQKATMMLEKEIELYPESAVFIKRILEAVNQ